MSDSIRKPHPATASCVALVVISLVAVVWGARPAWPQAPVPSFAPSPDSAAVAPQPPRRDNPGLINEIGKLWDKSSSMLPSLMPSPDQPAAAPVPVPNGAAVPPPPVDAAPAAEAPAAPRPSSSSAALVPAMISGRMQCPSSGSGSPDCKAAADQLCQTHGYRDGKGVLSDSTEVCSAKRLIPGRERKPEDCHTNYFVTRAFCQ